MSNASHSGQPSPIAHCTCAGPSLTLTRGSKRLGYRALLRTPKHERGRCKPGSALRPRNAMGLQRDARSLNPWTIQLAIGKRDLDVYPWQFDHAN